MRNSSILALDLEGTLISNAVSQIPRPGLYEFLTAVHQRFPRVVIYTTVKEHQFRQIARLLVAEGAAPAWFADIEYVNWKGSIKDLNFIPGARIKQTWLLDDMACYVHPDQESQWIPIVPFEAPYPDIDRELERLMQALSEPDFP